MEHSLDRSAANPEVHVEDHRSKRLGVLADSGDTHG